MNMSRSYKKSPVYTDGSRGTTKKAKRIAQKKVRKVDDLPMKGNAHKKVSESWTIHDYCNRWTWEEAKEQWERGENEYLKKHYPTLKEFYRYWLKCCHSK